jgi:hypothetical protein
VNLTNTERVDSFHGYERFCVEMEHLITDAVRRNHPRPWDEDNITHTILASLQTLSPKIQVHRHNRENINVLWDFFKLTGPAENHYGDIAFIVRMHQKDGQHTDGLGVIEAKKINAKRDEYTELLGARKSQLQKQVERLPYALVALYDHQEISGSFGTDQRALRSRQCRFDLESPEQNFVPVGNTSFVSIGVAISAGLRSPLWGR